MALTKVRRGGTDTGISDSSDATAITIDSSENVGIGTTSPTLTNGKGVVIADATATRLKLCDTTTGEGASDGFQIGHSGGLAFIFNHEDEPIQFGTNNTERARIDSSGNFFVSATATSGFQSSSSESGTIIYQAGGIASNSASNDVSAVFNRLGNDGTIVQLKKDGSTVGQIKTFNSTVQYGGAAAAIYLDTAAFLPANASGRTDNTIDLGNSSFRYNDAFITDGVTTGSDQNEKQDIADLTAKELNVANKLSALFKTYRWKDAVVEKGDKARTHSGIIAQDIQSAFSAEGLDASTYGMFMSDTWTNDDGKEQTRLGVRYPELFSFIFSSIEARLTALESK
jgi:hypothetical protein